MVKPEPQTVIIDEEQTPVPVVMADDSKSTPARSYTVKKGQGITLQPSTTEAEDEITKGQRNINLIWETTQSRIALLVVIAGIIVNSAVVLLIIFFNKEVTVTQLSLISICLQFINLTVGIVIGFYFSRTNHSAQGGVGYKPESPYVGR